jgi:preprotein translocase subunit SecF
MFQLNKIVQYKVGYIFGVASLFVILLSVFCIFLVPAKLSIEFVGGSLFDIQIQDDIIQNLDKFGYTYTIEKAGTSYLVKFPHHIKYDGLIEEISSFAKINSFASFSPFVTKSLIQKSLMAIMLSIAMIFIYIFLRFNVYYGLGAMLTLTHDVLIVIAFIKLMHIECDMSVIAAILTIVGYSINDTVIIYDKIREDLNIKNDFYQTILNSIKETLPRTIGTSLTTMLVIIPAIIFTSGSIQNFCLIVCVGILVGTFSSISVSSLILLPFRNRIYNLVQLKKTITQ